MLLQSPLFWTLCFWASREPAVSPTDWLVSLPHTLDGEIFGWVLFICVSPKSDSAWDKIVLGDSAG